MGLLVTVSSSVTTGCSDNRGGAANQGSSPRANAPQGANSVNGQIFVTVNTGGTVKFAGLEVLLLDRAETDGQLALARQHIQKGMEENTREMNASREQRKVDLAKAEADLAKARATLQTATVNLARYDAQTRARNLEHFQEMVRLAEIMADFCRNTVGASAPSGPVPASFVEFVRHRDEIRSLEFLFSRQWRGLVSKASTDADGNFSISIPSSGSFYLAANGVVTSGTGQDACFWFVPVQGGQASPIFLNNSNVKVK